MGSVHRSRDAWVAWAGVPIMEDQNLESLVKPKLHSDVEDNV